MDFIDSKRLKNFIDTANKTSQFGQTDVRNIMKSLISGVNYCHERSIIIRNLTPDTIMVKKSGGIMHASTIYEVKITDFSCAVPVGSTKNFSDHPLFDWADVPFLAPEALLDQPYGKSMDVWSMGVLLFLMLSGDLPFQNEDDKILLNTIKVIIYNLDIQPLNVHINYGVDMKQSAQYSFGDNPAWEAIKEGPKALIGQVLIANPAQRLTAKEMAKDPWISSG